MTSIFPNDVPGLRDGEQCLGMWPTVDLRSENLGCRSDHHGDGVVYSVLGCFGETCGTI